MGEEGKAAEAGAKKAEEDRKAAEASAAAASKAEEEKKAAGSIFDSGTNGELPNDKRLGPPAESPTHKEALGMESQHKTDPGHGISHAAKDDFEEFLRSTHATNP